MAIRGKRRYVAAVTLAMVSPSGAAIAAPTSTNNQAPNSSAPDGNPSGAKNAAGQGDDPAAAGKDKLAHLEPLKFRYNVTDGAEYGVGMPVTVSFGQDIPQAYRGKVLANVSVVADPPTEGAWRWVGDDRVTFRPAEYWKAGTKVQVRANLDGLLVHDKYYLEGEQQRSFTIGDEVLITIDNEEKHAHFRKNGETIKKVPVSLGRDHVPEYVTRSGVKVIMTQERRRTLRGDDYAVPVEYAQRLTMTGEFIHSAPWSVGSQGRANVSHGCTNVSTANAQWLFENAKIGDVVSVTGTTRQMEKDNGYGSVWAFDWDEWQQQGVENGLPVVVKPNMNRYAG